MGVPIYKREEVKSMTYRDEEVLMVVIKPAEYGVQITVYPKHGGTVLAHLDFTGILEAWQWLNENVKGE